MPELPEVQTTVNGLNRKVKGRKIVDVKTTYKSVFYRHKNEIKNPKYFPIFKKRVIGTKILKAERRAKNILIHLSPRPGSGQAGDTIIVHMKMTGNLVYNRTNYPFTRLDFTLDNGKHLILADMRKFAKVCLEKTKDLDRSEHLANLGPEPLNPSFKLKAFSLQLMKKPRGKIKQVLMDPSVIAGIGNIYSDEILWRAGIHPLSLAGKIPLRQMRSMFKAMKETLKKGIALGGDSNVDYRNIDGEKGSFQEHHRAYQRHKKLCLKKKCSGILEKIRIGGRSAHFCPKHQKLFR